MRKVPRTGKGKHEKRPREKLLFVDEQWKEKEEKRRREMGNEWGEKC